LKEKSESEGRGCAKIIEKMLPILDEFEIALLSAEKSPDETLRNGMTLMYGKLRGILEKEGLTEMVPLGEKFDPYRHEAVMREESDEPDGTIVKVIRKGYLLNGKILRHAMVGVAKGKEEDGGEKGGVGEGGKNSGASAASNSAAGGDDCGCV
jgi:molecular chaperone GrpE